MKPLRTLQEEYAAFLRAQRRFELARGRVILAYARAGALEAVPPLAAHPEPETFVSYSARRRDYTSGLVRSIYDNAPHIKNIRK